MNIEHLNFYVAQVADVQFPDFLDYSDAIKLEITVVLPGAVQLKDVMKTILPGMDPRGIIPIVKVYGKAPATKWESIRKGWDEYAAALQKEREAANRKSGLILNSDPIQKSPGHLN